jgi:UPF0271 protein
VSEVVPFGDVAWRAALPERVDARLLLDRLCAVHGVSDVVVSERHALIVLAHPGAASPAEIEDALASVGEAPSLRADPSRLHEVRVRYDGADLDETARIAGLPPEDVVAIHASVDYVVAAVGFLPGFAYLRGLDPRLVLPRRSSPRPRVAALSVGVAGPYTGVYPFASPGGWSLLGTAVGFAPFDAASGARLALGDRVRFIPRES